MSYASLLQTTITYWVPSTTDGAGGITYSAPTQILGRWQDTTDLFEDADGQEFVGSAIIYTKTELVENGWLYEGTSVVANPQNQSEAYRIRSLNHSQTPSGSLTVYKNIVG